MRIHKSQDQHTDITSIFTFSYDPSSPILVISKIRGPKQIPNDEIFEFMTFLRSINAIDQHLFDMVKSDFPHLFLPVLTETHIETLYEQMKTLVSQGLTKSRESGKKLLIIAGEKHDTRASLLLQALLLHIVNEVNIRNLFVEAWPDLLRKLVYEQRDQKTLNAEYSVPLAHNLRMNLIAADIDLSSGCISNHERESFMMTQILSLNENSLFICGCGHIKNLKLNEVLQRQYHIVAMNINCLSQRQMTFELSKTESQEQRAQLVFAVSDQVMQITLEGNASLIACEKLVDIAHAVHTRKKIGQQHALSAQEQPVIVHTQATQADAQRPMEEQDDNNKYHIVGNLHFKIENRNTNCWVLKLLRNDQEIKSISIEDRVSIDQLISKLSDTTDLVTYLRSLGKTSSKMARFIVAEAQIMASTTPRETQNNNGSIMPMLLAFPSMLFAASGAGPSASADQVGTDHFIFKIP